jgi:hypothetical protein
MGSFGPVTILAAFDTRPVGFTRAKRRGLTILFTLMTSTANVDAKSNLHIA